MALNIDLADSQIALRLTAQLKNAVGVTVSTLEMQNTISLVDSCAALNEIFFDVLDPISIQNQIRN